MLYLVMQVFAVAVIVWQLQYHCVQSFTKLQWGLFMIHVPFLNICLLTGYFFLQFESTRFLCSDLYFHA
jgi:hypothetical protein